MHLTRIEYIGRDYGFQKVLFLLEQGNEAIGVSAWRTLPCLRATCIVERSGMAGSDMPPGEQMRFIKVRENSSVRLIRWCCIKLGAEEEIRNIQTRHQSRK